MWHLSNQPLMTRALGRVAPWEAGLHSLPGPGPQHPTGEASLATCLHPAETVTDTKAAGG